MNKVQFFRLAGILAVFLLAGCASYVEEQTTARRFEWIVSPEVHPDNRVTFRYRAPDAGEVLVDAQFESDPVAMTLDTSGVWSGTLGPVKPDIYPYSFLVDGIRVMDSGNSHYFPNERFKGSLVDIRGETPLVHSLKDVPHGLVHYEYYPSETLGTNARVLVYTPPGYEESSGVSYPVFYLVSGATDTEETYFKVGRANLIVDNLIAAGKAVPMIIVMPYANPYPELRELNRQVEADLLATDLFTDEIIHEVIPAIEENYRAQTGPENRAIAGFSLGGRQTLAAGLGHPEIFSWVFAYAPAIFDRELDDLFEKTYAGPEDLNEALNQLWVSCGRDDGLYEASVKFTGLLKDKGINHETFFTDGGHTWMNCRLFLAETARRLFE
ncbi:MAG TPA: esterase family protein [Bacteroidetes bacterium]|nr:esterase family protein [Bacteroidota bacterium]